MNRLTEKLADGGYKIDPRAVGEAVRRLGLYEDVHQSLLDNNFRMDEELARLRAQGKQKSVRFRELLGQKMVNQNLLGYFELRKL